jgi:hypothetical protein
MSEDTDSIRQTLVGNSGRTTSTPFLMAIRAFTRWPVDAFSYEINTERHERKLYWLQGNALGWLGAVGQTESPTISGLVRPVGEISRVTLLGTVVGLASGPGEVNRVLAISFRTPAEGAAGEPLHIGAAVNQLDALSLTQTNKLIDAVLDAVAGRPASAGN